MLKEMIRHAGKSGTREVVLGMAHRGRLNVLINVLGKQSQELFDEFSGKHKEHLGTGDVKYHMGFSSDIETEGGLVHLALAFNPSHLEIVSPVVIGSVRARLDRLDEPSSNKVVPITIHGDAAVTGPGVDGAQFLFGIGQRPGQRGQNPGDAAPRLLRDLAAGADPDPARGRRIRHQSGHGGLFAVADVAGR